MMMEEKKKSGSAFFYPSQLSGFIRRSVSEKSVSKSSLGLAIIPPSSPPSASAPSSTVGSPRSPSPSFNASAHTNASSSLSRSTDDMGRMPGLDSPRLPSLSLSMHSSGGDLITDTTTSPVSPSSSTKSSKKSSLFAPGASTPSQQSVLRSYVSMPDVTRQSEDYVGEKRLTLQPPSPTPSSSASASPMLSRNMSSFFVSERFNLPEGGGEQQSRLTMLISPGTNFSAGGVNVAGGTNENGAAKRSVERKVEKLVALREAITIAVREINARLDRIDGEVKRMQSVDPELAKRLRELVKFLRSLIDTQVENTNHNTNSRASMILRTSGSTLSLSAPERLDFFKGIMNTALVEIRCKLGSIQKRVAGTTSLSTTMSDAQTVRSVKQFLDGRGTLEIDPARHKIVAPPPASLLQQDKYKQLIRATKFSSNEIITKLQQWLKIAECTDSKLQSTASKRAKEIKDIFDKHEEEEVYVEPDGMPPPSNNTTPDLPETVKYIVSSIDTNTRIIVQAEGNTGLPTTETFAFIIRFAKKLRLLKKYILRIEREDGVVREDIPVGVQRLIELLNKELTDPKDESSSNYEIQEDISALNTRRHLLTLSIRNLDRKINFLIKSRRHKEEATEMEEEEVYQFFDQTTSEENPLRNLKEHYEQFISILRKQPHYLAGIIPFMSFGEMDSLVQTITFSLFSDLYLAREEYLMLSLIEAIMKAEFVACKEVDQYLRANSFITKLLAGYTKRQSGRLHLAQALKTSVLAVAQDSGLDLEMDTSKLYKTIVLKEAGTIKANGNKNPMPPPSSSLGAAEESAEKIEAEHTEDSQSKLSFEVTSEHPDVKRVFNEHKFKLVHFCKMFLDNIITSLPTMPFGIRWIAQQLATKAREKFPDVPDLKIDLLIGGFIFLRYLCPAIVAPESHGIVSHITQKARRNLILIAKVLQNLANNFPFSKKEQFMSPMNTFLEEHQQLLHDYFIQVMNVGDYSAYYRMSSLKRAPPHQIERTVTISPNDLYDIHRKLIKHESVVIPNPKEDPLAKLLSKMGPAPENLPRRQNKFVLLNVYSIPEPDNSAKELSPDELFVQGLKDELTKALSMISPTSINAEYTSMTLLQIIDRVEMTSEDQALTELLGGIREKLQMLQPAMKDNNFLRLLQLVEKDYQQRVMVREALLTEKVEQLEALDHQKREVARLLEEKKIYSQYLQNVMLDAYGKKIRNKPMIGPYKFSIQQLERRGVIAPSANLASLRNTVEIKMSCTNPGSINITTKYRKFSRFFELQLLDLMDDLVLHDTVNYDEIVFDTRKLISFINKYILG